MVFMYEMTLQRSLRRDRKYQRASIDGLVLVPYWIVYLTYLEPNPKTTLMFAIKQSNDNLTRQYEIMESE